MGSAASKSKKIENPEWRPGNKNSSITEVKKLKSDISPIDLMKDEKSKKDVKVDEKLAPLGLVDADGKVKNKANPEFYKELAKIDGKIRVDELTLPVGKSTRVQRKDGVFVCYLEDAKIKVTAIIDGEEKSEKIYRKAKDCVYRGDHEISIKNIGDTPVKAIMFEPHKDAGKGDNPDLAKGFESDLSVFKVEPDSYKVLCENDKWYLAEMVIEVGQKHGLHVHHCRMHYVLEGEEVTTYPLDDESKAIKEPITPGEAIAAPVEDKDGKPTQFSKHSARNTGSTKVVMLKCEQKHANQK